MEYANSAQQLRAYADLLTDQKPVEESTEEVSDQAIQEDATEEVKEEATEDEETVAEAKDDDDDKEEVEEAKEEEVDEDDEQVDEGEQIEETTDTPAPQTTQDLLRSYANMVAEAQKKDKEEEWKTDLRTVRFNLV